MSQHVSNDRVTPLVLQKMKGNTKIVSLTAYTSSMASLVDPHVELIIVGDSVGMVAYGQASTLGVSLETMINHGAAVVRGANRACVIIDMPFGSYQESPQQAFRNASRVLSRTGAQGVKLEGGAEMLATTQFLVERGIPVMAHIGLTPQHVNRLGGFKAQARTAESTAQLRDVAVAFAQHGAFALLVEAISEPAAARITAAVNIPVIGIGASPACDGQVLVTEDILGLFSDYSPRFVKRYAELSPLISTACAQFAMEVRQGSFPTSAHCFTMLEQPME
ncbi:3-methyl-2-oxobutanoate hydroxymethyltransferase [Shewanella salipaludis]|uniref:3-methyl-2-oxobutanoate hydroxymethyltransferase n=1 Tax=Shewanella salipaludis TaxID=2723052 RepID=A0A972JJX6_9GAMM|nr:3-methyl-2-oxobutanoate hydroxymethyltransferase [Shewanella salipaludis]NMH65615.1 3-methyl-2-oxobutanoate hydroxymethyltransferase [Shewanella salipaludis]